MILLPESPAYLPVFTVSLIITNDFFGPGSATTPGRVFKGKKMAGHYGHETVTVQNLKIAKVDAENNLIAIKGAIPGPKGGIVVIADAVKA